jgi:hypothetical protein
MKLGEALALRADLQKRMNQVQALLLANATMQEGDRPIVAPDALLAEYRRLTAEHVRIVRQINRTNVAARVQHGEATLTLADAVVQREALAREAKLLREIARSAAPKQSRWLRTEVKHVPTVDVSTLLHEADRLSRAHRELDTRMQQVNWEAELIEA